MRRALTAIAAVAFAWLSTAANASPKAGESFPRFAAEDLVGTAHNIDELAGRRTLLIAIVDRGAVKALREWFTAAEARVPASVARETIISLHLPFLITTATMRGEAREQAPENYWHATLLDRGEMGRELALPASKVPYVFVLDENLRIVAAVHATIDSLQANEVWNAFGDTQR